MPQWLRIAVAAGIVAGLTRDVEPFPLRLAVILVAAGALAGVMVLASKRAGAPEQFRFVRSWNVDKATSVATVADDLVRELELRSEQDDVPVLAGGSQLAARLLGPGKTGERLPQRVTLNLENRRLEVVVEDTFGFAVRDKRLAAGYERAANRIFAAASRSISTGSRRMAA